MELFGVRLYQTTIATNLFALLSSKSGKLLTYCCLRQWS